MDRFEVLLRLKQREIDDPDAGSIPVILLTNLAPEEGEQATISMSASHYLTKDWAPGIVDAAVRVALRDADKGRELATREAKVHARRPRPGHAVRSPSPLSTR